MRISNNFVEGFAYGIAGDFGATVDKNVVRYVNRVGIGSFGGKKVTDNTVAFEGGVSDNFGGIVVDSMPKNSSVTGNTVTALNGPGFVIHNAAPDGFFEGGQLKTFANNNVYSTDYGLNRCGVRINDAGTPFDMKKNFYGNNSNPLILPEVLDPYGAVAASGIGDAICVTSGLFDNVTGVIENVTYNPTNKPNPEVRVEVVNALSNSEAFAAKWMVLNALNDADRQVVVAALEVLDVWQDPTTVPYVEAILQRTSDSEIVELAESIVEYNSDLETVSVINQTPEEREAGGKSSQRRALQSYEQHRQRQERAEANARQGNRSPTRQ